MTSIPDSELLAHFRAGDAYALEAIFERYEGPVFQFLLGMLRDHHQAEDVLQDTFIKALERLGDVDGNHLRGWLFTVAYRQAMLLKRQQKRRDRNRVDDEVVAWSAAPGLDPFGAAANREEVGRLRELIEQLPSGQREVVRARVYEGKRFRDIADDLGCPLNTALARMHNGLQRLRQLWEGPHV